MTLGDRIASLVQAHYSRDEARFRGQAVAATSELRERKSPAADRVEKHIPARDAPALTLLQRDEHGLISATMPAAGWDSLVLPDTVRRDLEDFVEENVRAAELRERGLSPDRRVLLCGPPGTGKTSAASVVAARLGRPLYVVRVDALVKSFMGETAANVRKVFDAAKRDGAVLFLDEVDSLLSARGTDDSGAGKEATRVTSALLTMLEEADGPLVIAATNHDGALDPASWRRWDRVVRFALPSRDELRELVRVTAGDMRREWEAEWQQGVVKDLGGMSHAEVVREVRRWMKRRVLSAPRCSEVAGGSL